MLYIDFDDVILDTGIPLFEEWRKNPHRHSLPESEKIKYIQSRDWNDVLKRSEIINDSIYYLKNMDPNKSFILTKTHSLANEGTAKVMWLRKQGVKQSVILVPYPLKKTDMVDAEGNILIDDGLMNLDHWVSEGGTPVFFDMNDDNIDTWGLTNVNNYERIINLSKYCK